MKTRLGISKESKLHLTKVHIIDAFLSKLERNSFLIEGTKNKKTLFVDLTFYAVVGIAKIFYSLF